MRNLFLFTVLFELTVLAIVIGADTRAFADESGYQFAKPVQRPRIDALTGAVRSTNLSLAAQKSAPAARKSPNIRELQSTYVNYEYSTTPNGNEDDLIRAILFDDTDKAEFILRRHHQFAKTVHSYSTLRLAACAGRTRICEFLLSSNADLDLNDCPNGRGLPIIADAVRFPSIVHLLIDHGCDINTPVNEKSVLNSPIGTNATVLHYAASNGRPESINLLLDAGAPVLARAKVRNDRSSKQTALDVATARGLVSNVSAILTHYCFQSLPAETRNSLLNDAMATALGRSRHSVDTMADVITLLVDHGGDPTLTINERSVVQHFAARIRPNYRNENERLQNAIAYLESRGASVDILSAIATNDIRRVESLVADEPRLASVVDADLYPALHIAIEMDCREIVNMLLKAGSNVETRNNCASRGGLGAAPIHTAAFWGRESILEHLIDAGADVNAVDSNGRTPLHNAVRMSHLDTVHLLLRKNANRDARDKHNKTPAHYCSTLDRATRETMNRALRQYPE
jgi:ankyrin repeat protein